MQTIKLSDISMNITNETIGEEVYKVIAENLKLYEIIKIDFEGINVITTFCAKQIFKKLLNELGEENFNKKILFENITPTIEYEINMGLND